MRILVASTTFPVAAEMLAKLLPDDEVLVDHRRVDEPVDVIVPLMSRIDAGMMDRFRPRLIQQFGVGLEGVDLAAAAERGIAVANVAGHDTGNADGVGEIAVLHLLALTRRLHEAREAVQAGKLGEPIGVPLSGARIVVLGLGAVGRAVVNRLSGFRAHITGVGSRDASDLSDEVRALALEAYLPVARLLDALAGADALIVGCVLNQHTRGLVGARTLAALRTGGYLVNVARGPVVDYAALLAALRSGQIGGAGLDVFWDEPIDPLDPLLEQNVSVTPHIGGVTTGSYRLMAERVVAGIERHRG
ncbi:MAG TPA: NAD(P)-dependent oxidoreductase [Solirubrobacteraceae bacterium]|nr:NAD(P)-dependent oxidoreductase [Solirubrobacteraceae bacterium]